LMWLPIPLQRLGGAIERRFPRSSGIVALSVLRQVRCYLRDAHTKAEIDQITAAAADGSTVIIGHSLGTVVAYEYLRQNPARPVKLLLTVGSPLGFRTVRRWLPAGFDAHAAERYLSCKAVGKALIDVLPELGQ